MKFIVTIPDESILAHTNELNELCKTTLTPGGVLKKRIGLVMACTSVETISDSNGVAICRY